MSQLQKSKLSAYQFKQLSKTETVKESKSPKFDTGQSSAKSESAVLRKNTAPKSLVTVVKSTRNDTTVDFGRILSGSSPSKERKNTNKSDAKTQSLMDIDFSSAQIRSDFLPYYKSEHSPHGSKWKTDSMPEKFVSAHDKRSINLQPQQHVKQGAKALMPDPQLFSPSFSKNFTPLVVDMKMASHNERQRVLKQPMSLLEFQHVPKPSPVSHRERKGLLEFPEPKLLQCEPKSLLEWQCGPKPLLDSLCSSSSKKAMCLFDFPTPSRRKRPTSQNLASVKRKKPTDNASSSTVTQKKSSPVLEEVPLQEPVGGESCTGSSLLESEGSSGLHPAEKDENGYNSPAEKDDRTCSTHSEEENNRNTRLTAFEGKGKTFVVIPAKLSWLHLLGRAKVTVLRGSCIIMAYTLKEGSTYDVYSPTSGCLLAMQAEESVLMAAADVKEELTKHGVSFTEADAQIIKNENCAILMLQKLESVICDYLTSFIPFTQLFSVTKAHDVDLGVTLHPVGLKVAPEAEMSSNCMQWSPEYNNVLDKWIGMVDSKEGSKCPILLTCGAKNSGKSVFNRCAVNSALQRTGKVAYLDFDVGQTEFSPPATVSLHIVKEPLFGPPSCHQQKAERMCFYGDVNPAQDPDFYVKCMQFIFGAYKELSHEQDLPLVVNTMGFLEGVGLMLLIDAFHIVEPDLVVQMESFFHHANFPSMNREKIAMEDGWTFRKSPNEKYEERLAKTKEHKLQFLQTLASPKRGFSLRLLANDLRNLTLMSHLGNGLEAGMTLTSQPPYMVPYGSLGLHVCHHQLPAEDVLSAMDASIVALCEGSLNQAKKEESHLPFTFSETPICNCIGLGIVRCIDQNSHQLFIMTTLPRILLKKVNIMLKGSLALPDQFLLNQKCSSDVQYADALVPAVAVGSVRRRNRLPRQDRC